MGSCISHHTGATLLHEPPQVHNSSTSPTASPQPAHTLAQATSARDGHPTIAPAKRTSLDNLTCETTTTVYVQAKGADVQRSNWFTSWPLDKATLQGLHTVQLHTISHDQGYADDPFAGTWTWFELSIERPLPAQGGWDLLMNPETKEPYRFESHRNPQAHGEPQHVSGTKFESGHMIWKLLKPGDRLIVSACARFAGWSNTGLSARIQFWHEPPSS